MEGFLNPCVHMQYPQGGFTCSVWLFVYLLCADDEAFSSELGNGVLTTPCVTTSIDS